MSKKIAIILFLCLIYPLTSFSNYKTDSEEWCGIYFEENKQGHIALSQKDLGIGSKNCSLEKYKTSVEEYGTTNIILDFTKSRSMVNKWRKFNGHLIVVHGKINYNKLINPRFIRDLGI